MERRSFLKLSCGLGAGILLSSLGVSVLPIEAFAQELTKYDRIKTAKQSKVLKLFARLFQTWLKVTKFLYSTRKEEKVTEN